MSGREDPFRGGVAVYGAPPPSAIRDWPQQPQPLVLPNTQPQPFVVTAPQVDPPPPRPEADPEAAILAALSRLDDAARARVLRYAVDRWGTP
jgi:hypothetical protein